MAKEKQIISLQRTITSSSTITSRSQQVTSSSLTWEFANKQVRLCTKHCTSFENISPLCCLCFLKEKHARAENGSSVLMDDPPGEGSASMELSAKHSRCTFASPRYLCLGSECKHAQLSGVQFWLLDISDGLFQDAKSQVFTTGDLPLKCLSLTCLDGDEEEHQSKHFTRQ